MTDRERVERTSRLMTWLIALSAIAAALVVLYHFVHSGTGLGGDLPAGLLRFCLVSLPFLGIFYLFSRVIRWVLLGFVEDDERRAQRSDR